MTSKLEETLEICSLLSTNLRGPGGYLRTGSELDSHTEKSLRSETYRERNVRLLQRLISIVCETQTELLLGAGWRSELDGSAWRHETGALVASDWDDRWLWWTAAAPDRHRCTRPQKTRAAAMRLALGLKPLESR